MTLRQIAFLIIYARPFLETSRGDGTYELNDINGIFKHRPIDESNEMNLYKLQLSLNLFHSFCVMNIISNLQFT